MAPQTIRIDFPFEMELEHPDIDMVGMFHATHAFDAFEVQVEQDSPAAQLTVDVLETGRNTTILRITPKKGMTYNQISTVLEPWLNELSASTFNDGLRTRRIIWHMAEYGISSDNRRTLQRIN